MKFQSLAINVANNLCLADCYITAAANYNNIRLTNARKASIIFEAIDKGYLGEDAFVKDPVSLMKLAVPGTSYTIAKTSIDKSKGDYVAVRYRYNGNGHWTLFDKTGMIYNGLDYSNCVTKGSPDLNDVRDIIQL